MDDLNRKTPILGADNFYNESISVGAFSFDKVNLTENENLKKQPLEMNPIDFFLTDPRET